MAITALKVRPLKSGSERLPTEDPEGLRYAVVFNGNKIIALFDDVYWAERLIEGADLDLEIYEVVD